MNSAETHNLPDLKELETIESKDYSAIPIVIFGIGFCISMTIFIVWLYIKLRNELGGQGLSAFVLMIGFVLYLLIRGISGYISYKVDENGITIRSIIRKYRVAWDEIVDASSVKTRLKDNCLVIKTKHRIFKLNRGWMSGSDASFSCVIASIWQHLRRFNKHHRIELSDSALTLWEPIPDEISPDHTWGKQPTPAQQTLTVIGISIFVIFCLLGSISMKDNKFMMIYYPSLMITAIFILKDLIFSEALHTAKQLVITESGLEAVLLFRKIYLPWTSINNASWKNRSLLLQSANPSAEILIPYVLGNKDSEDLILAIIQKLRANLYPPALTFPMRISKDQTLFNQQAYSGQMLHLQKKAFLQTLNEPARTKIQRISNIIDYTCISLILGSCLIIFADCIGVISRWIYNRPESGTIYFIPSCSLVATLLSIPVVVAIPCMFLDRKAKQWAEPYRAEWLQFCQVGSSKKFCWLIPVFVGIGVAGLLMTPLYIDCYLKVTDHGVITNRLFEYNERCYDWSQIQAINATTTHRYNDGVSSSDTSYRLTFSDGSHWEISEGNYIKISQRKQIQSAMALISTKSKKSFQLHDEFR